MVCCKVECWCGGQGCKLQSFLYTNVMLIKSFTCDFPLQFMLKSLSHLCIEPHSYYLVSFSFSDLHYVQVFNKAHSYWLHNPPPQKKTNNVLLRQTTRGVSPLRYLAPLVHSPSKIETALFTLTLKILQSLPLWVHFNTQSDLTDCGIFCVVSPFDYISVQQQTNLALTFDLQKVHCLICIIPWVQPQLTTVSTTLKP